MGKPDVAKGFFAQAHVELSKMSWFVEEEAERLARIKTLGGLE